MIREIEINDKEAILSILEDSGKFDTEGLAHIEETLNEHLKSGSNGLWYIAFENKPIGVVYCTPEPLTSGTWNLLMLWIQKEKQGKGYGTALVKKIEDILVSKKARLLIVETSGLDEFKGARAFYEKYGFRQEARIKDFFEAGDDKLIYTKSINIK